jgi:steroid delta-isomerase-like uncharacterized protein
MVVGKGKPEESSSVAEENAARTRLFYEQVLDRGNLEAADEFLAAGLVDHDAFPGQGPGLEGFKRSLANLRSAFPDLRVTLEDVIPARDKVVVRWTDRGTHRGEFLGMAPTGRKVSTTGITIYRFFGGKIVEQWTNWDTLTLMGQLGARDRPPRDLVGRMLRSQEEERRRVAYEVHDGLAQTAVGVHSLLEAFTENYPPDSAPARKELERVLALVQSMVEESRRVIGRLRPTALDYFGLAAALRLHAEALRKEGFEVSYEQTLGDERLPAEVETALFRVAQEALTNARKHSRSAMARVRLGRLGGTVCLRVRDWGLGFEESTLPDDVSMGAKVGLYGMRERVALLGGDLEVRSKPGGGTLVVARIPSDSAGR